MPGKPPFHFPVLLPPTAPTREDIRRHLLWREFQYQVDSNFDSGWGERRDKYINDRVGGNNLSDDIKDKEQKRWDELVASGRVKDQSTARTSPGPSSIKKLTLLGSNNSNGKTLLGE